MKEKNIEEVVTFCRFLPFSATGEQGEECTEIVTFLHLYGV